MCQGTFFVFDDTATTEIYTLSLHDALPIYRKRPQALPLEHRLAADDGEHDARVPDRLRWNAREVAVDDDEIGEHAALDRKSTRLNSSHANISYAVFCLKKKITLSLHRRPLH